MLKQTQKALDDTQNDNFVLKSENNRMYSEIQSMRIRAKDHETMFHQISELKTQKFSLERKIQDMLTADTGTHHSAEIKSQIEYKQLQAQVSTLNSLILEKSAKIEDQSVTIQKLSSENQDLKVDLAKTSTRFDEREKERHN